jgi:hypothetical protein
MRDHPEHLAEKNALKWLSEDDGETCESHFELARRCSGQTNAADPGFRIQGTGVTCGQTSSDPLVHRLSPSEADLVPSLASQEIASLSLWRSQAYRDYFQALEDAGGFFYERWVSHDQLQSTLRYDR